MDVKGYWKRYEDRIIPLLCVLLLFGVAGVWFDFYYDLNDDVLIKDILAGVYTGTPESRNVQMLWPLGAFLALLYRMMPGVPVLGGFLWLCQAGSIYCILRCSLRFAASSWGKWFLNLAETAAIGSMLFYHFVFVQYTVTSGLLMTAAVVSFLTCEADGHSIGRWIRRNLPAMGLALLAFLVRSEMMLLLLPLAGVAGIWKWAGERPVVTKRNVACYMGLFGGILLGMLAVFLADAAAYGSGEWKAFRELFDARTEIYDFKSAKLRSYEGNEAFYDSLGLSGTQCVLLENYNYGISEKIDAALLQKISDYGRKTQGYFLHSPGEGLWLYRERLRDNRALGFREMPFLLVEAVLLMLLLLVGLQQRKREIFWQLGLFAAVRSVLWLYLILRERVPERISHPLYFMEIGMLAASLLRLLAQEEWGRSPARKGIEPSATLPRFPARPVAAALLTVIALAGLPEEWGRTAEQYAARERENELDLAARAYYGEHPDRLYLADVMSTVDFSEKLFAADDGFGNYDLLGGWLCKSPLARKKLQAFGYDTVQEAVTDAGTFLAGREEVSWDWLVEALAEQGIRGEVVRMDTVSTQEEKWGIWQFVPREE